MTAAELIAELRKCEPTRKVRMFISWDSMPEVAEVSRVDSDGFVVLGDDLPPEVFAEDYRYERG